MKGEGEIIGIGTPSGLLERRGRSNTTKKGAESDQSNSLVSRKKCDTAGLSGSEIVRGRASEVRRTERKRSGKERDAQLSL